MNAPQETTINEALLAEAYIQGRKTGRMLLPVSLNPFRLGSPESDEWCRGWRAAVGEAMPCVVTRAA